MKTLFSDIYNRIRELFQIEKSENTSECAASRLQVILMHDRTKLDPLIMNKMREELIDVFSKYVVIDKEELEIGLKQEGDAAALMLNIPIVRAKTEEELEELRKKLQAEETKVSDDDETDEAEECAEGETEEDIQTESETDIEVTADKDKKIVEEKDTKVVEEITAITPESEDDVIVEEDSSKE